MTNTYEIAIIGAGPIGLEVAASLKRVGANYIQFDANQIGHTMTWWPDNTPFFSTTERLAIAGVPIQNNHQQRITGEEYLAYLRFVVEMFDLQIHSHEPVAEIKKEGNQFTLITNKPSGKQTYTCKKVILAMGDMHWANELHIAGENLPHVSHYFRNPHDYFRKKLLIIGGRNSAAEAALRCFRAGASVTVSYRREKMNQRTVKHWLLPDLEAQFEAGTIQFLPNTTPVEITPSHVVLQPCDDGVLLDEAEPILHETDFVLLNTGFRGDQSLLQQLGVTLEGENHVPVFDPDTMETNIDGVYLAGTVAAGVQQKYKLFIENCHDHALKLTRALTGTEPTALGSVAERNYELPFEAYEAN